MTFKELVGLTEVNDTGVVVRVPHATVKKAIEHTKPCYYGYFACTLVLCYVVSDVEMLEITLNESQVDYARCSLIPTHYKKRLFDIDGIDPEVLAEYYKGTGVVTAEKEEYLMEEPMEEDRVNHPSHYTQGNLEVIDIMDDKMSPEEFKGFLKGNVLKYLFRSPHKGTEQEDLEKCSWYLNRLIVTVHEENWGTNND